MSACGCELDTLRVVQVANAPLGEVASFEGFVDTLYLLGREVRAGLGSVAGAALAVPGPFDCTRGVSLMQHKLQARTGATCGARLRPDLAWHPTGSGS